MTRYQKRLLTQAQILLADGKVIECSDILAEMAGKRKKRPRIEASTSQIRSKDFDFVANFDGGAPESQRANHGRIGVVIVDKHGELVQEIGADIHAQVVTSNYAEHSSAAVALHELARIAKRGDTVLLQGDSKLVVQQLCKRWKAKGGAYIEAYKRSSAALEHLHRMGVHVTIRWIPRELNEAADALCA